MASKAAKLRLKRTQAAGRPRKENVERFPSGKIKPFETEKDAKSVANEARLRVHGIEKESEYAGYTLGRIYLDGKITLEQLEAGNAYSEIIARYHRLYGIPFPSARAQSLFTIRSHEAETTEERAKKARAAVNKMMECISVLQMCKDGPQVKSTVHNVSVMDLEHLRTMPLRQMSWLCRGLDALHEYLGLPKHNLLATVIAC